MSSDRSKPPKADYGVEVLTRDSSRDEIKKVFDDWAQTYEKDTTSHGYVAPTTCTTIFDSILEKHFQATKTELCILDAGAGTGLVGEILKSLCYSNVDALDISEEMLAIAKGKNLYQRLICAAITKEPIDEISSDHYDALISVGTFSVGHAKPDGMEEILRVVKPGGIVCFTIVQAFYEDDSCGYESKADELENAKKWQLVHKELITQHTNNKKREKSYVLAFKILGQEHAHE